MARGARKHTSVKQRGKESSLNGMTVKWTDATTASGMIFSMTMEFDGFSKSEMPKSEFLFLSVAGLCINGHLDARQHKACGYVVLKRKRVSLEKFHAWYTHRVIGDYFKEIREKYGFTSREGIPECEMALVFSDSAVTNIKFLTRPEEMQRNFMNGQIHSKIGSKTTHVCQLMDNCDGFFTKRHAERTNMTGIALAAEIKQQLKELHDSGEFLLKAPRKLDAIIDCGATAPELQGKAYSKKKVVDAYVSVGLLDETTKTCPDIVKMMERFGHSHNDNAVKRNECLDRLPAIMKAQITDEMVKEEVYDKLLVDSDCNLLGNDWGLKSSSDIQSRAKILSNRSLLNEKLEDMMDDVEVQRQKMQLKISQARDVLNTNEAIEEKFQCMSKLPSRATVEDFAALNKKELIAFVTVRQ
jgi:hypothetical protein